MSSKLCLRGALRATSGSSGSGSASTRSIISAKAQALRLNGTSGGGLALSQLSRQPPSSIASRQYTTSTASAASSSSPSSSSSSSSSSSASSSAAALTSASTVHAQVPSAVDVSQTLSAEIADSGEAAKKDWKRLQRIVNKHLDHMSDPWKIAKYVEDALKKDRFQEALLLTQKASRDGQVVVAWNHLIDHELGRDNIKAAIKLYNEMKKRGQLPNVQTFTIIFRGCARSKHPKLAIAEAMKHYNILLSDPRLQPNSTHLNAVLNVCARAGDLDSLFLAADTVNDSTRAPTAYTYTTIFNALRYHAIHNNRDISEEEQIKNIRKAIDRAKSIWTEVIDKWRRGRLLIDEELVCAMGRLLLLSRSRDEKRSILDLLQQTMNIPNLTTAATNASATVSSIASSNPVPAAAAAAAAALEHGHGNEHEQDANPDPRMRNIAVSGSTPLPVPSASSAAVYAIPGRNTLALVCTILASAKLTTSGIKYWNLMVRHYGIVPDRDNWLRFFGMLKVARASAHAAAVIAVLPDADAKASPPLPFRIAMETCVRDNINPNAFANANLVLDAMLTRLDVPDLLTLRHYLRVALVAHYQMREKAQAGDHVAAKRQYGTQIIAALERLWEPYKRTHYHYFKAAPAQEASSPSASLRGSSNPPPLGEPYNNKREVISLARHMFSAFNKVQDEHLLPYDETRGLRPRYAKVNREIQAFFADRDDLEPNIQGRGSSRARLSATGRRPGRDEREVQHKDNEDCEDMGDRHQDTPLMAEEVDEEEEEGGQDSGASVKRGGDFVWNTRRPVDIVTRRERLRKEAEEWGRSRREKGNTPTAREPRRR